MGRRKALHSHGQTLSGPRFSRAKKLLCALRHLVSPSGRNTHNLLMLRLAHFFSTKPKQAKLEVTGLNESREMKIKVSMKLK